MVPVVNATTLGPNPHPDFSRKWVKRIRNFVLDVKRGDKMVMVFDGSVHIGTVCGRLLDDDTPRLNGEYFKCHKIVQSRSYPLSQLPSVYRLIGNMQGTLGAIRAYLPRVRLLDRCTDPDGVRAELLDMPVEDFLCMLAPEQWEVLCAEYLRDLIGFRFLLLQPGKTLKHADLVGVDSKQRRVIAQCKNDSTPRDLSEVRKWLADPSLSPNDVTIYFCRGGVTGQQQSLRCAVIDQKVIADWLRSNPRYLESIKQF